MTPEQKMGFMLRGIALAPRLGKMMEIARDCAALRLEMQAAGGDIPATCRPTYDAAETFLKAMEAYLANSAARYGLPNPYPAQKAAEPQVSGVGAMVAGLFGNGCNRPECVVCSARKPAEPKSSGLLEFIESLLTARAQDRTAPKPPRSDDVRLGNT